MADKNAPKCNCPTEELASDDSKATPVLRCCVKQRNWVMLKNINKTGDVCFIVGSEPDTQNILAHKIVLSASSTVFEAMFGKDWASGSNEIKVPDIEPAIFSSMIKFIYTDDVEITAESVMKILYAAKKYDIHALERRCSDFLKEQLCAENVCVLLTQARLFDQPKLIEACLEVIDEYSEEVFTSDNFINIDLASLRSILERDSLTMDELDVFKAVLRWAAAECERKNKPVNRDNQKEVLDGAESLIRFPRMTQEEFASQVSPSGLLSKDDIINVFHYFSGVPNTLCRFNITPRSSRISLVVKRFQTVYSSGWPCSGEKDGIGFSCDHSLKLVGFGLHTHSGSATYNIDITVKNQATSNILYQKTFDHCKDGDDHVFKFLLEKPIKLEANTLYGVITKSQAPEVFWSLDGQPSVCVEDVKRGKTVRVTFKNLTNEGCDRKTTVTQGQIPQILFSW